MKKTIYIILSITIIIFIICYFIINQTKTSKNKINIAETTNYDLPIKSEEDIKRERLDSIINERKNTIFDKSIFAGIYFGDSKEVVLQKLKIYKKTFGNNIFIDSCSYAIDKISYEFDLNRLYTLEITFETSISEKEIQSLLYPKYGETNTSYRYHYWKYKNVHIHHEVHGKYTIYKNPIYGGKIMYETQGGGLTDSQKYYSQLRYLNTDIFEERQKRRQEELNREKQIQDSITYHLELKKKTEAKKMSNKQLDNI